MAYALHEVDEETDVGAFQAYLRAQSNADLFDIAQHLDAERYPARKDAARRELSRRRVFPLHVYTANEYAVRYLALFSLALSAATLALSALLTPEEAAAPDWPEDIPDGMPVTRVMRMVGVALLRGVVVRGVHWGVYPLLWAILGGWTLFQAVRLRRRRTRADVWRFVALAWVILSAAIGISGVPGSAVAQLFAPQDGVFHAAPLLDPFA